jgi:hypothetical protein
MAIAALARGGEYELAAGRLRELAALDLRAGLTADALLRGRQAAEIARDHGDLADELRAHLILAIGLCDGGDPTSAEAAADLVLGRIGECRDDQRLLLSTLTYLVRGIASRRSGRLDAARVALGQARERAVRLGRPDLSGVILAELGATELAAGDPLAAAVCFGFARDVRRLIHQAGPARGAAALTVAAFVEAGEVAHAIELAAEELAEAEAAGDAEAAARLAAVRADAIFAAGEAAAAMDAALDAAARVAGLGEAARAELGPSARLRLVRLEPEPTRALMHLEAAIDLGLSARDGAAIAHVLDVLVASVVSGARPAETWDVVAALAAACRHAGLPALADLADQAQAELR